MVLLMSYKYCNSCRKIVYSTIVCTLLIDVKVVTVCQIFIVDKYMLYLTKSHLVFDNWARIKQFKLLELFVHLKIIFVSVNTWSIKWRFCIWLLSHRLPVPTRNRYIVSYRCCWNAIFICFNGLITICILGRETSLIFLFVKLYRQFKN